MMWVTVMWTGGEPGAEEGCGKLRRRVCVPFSTVCVEAWQWCGSLYFKQEKNVELRKGVGNRGVGCVCLSVQCVYCEQEKNLELKKVWEIEVRGVCLSEQCVLRCDNDVYHCNVNRRRRIGSWKSVWEIKVWGVCAFQYSISWGVTMMWVTVLWTGREEPGSEEGCGKSRCGVCMPFRTVYVEAWQWCGSLYCEQEEKNLELRKEGVGVILDSTLPHLIGVDDDILSTGIMLYHLKVTRLGLVPFWSDFIWLITFIQRKSLVPAF